MDIARVFHSNKRWAHEKQAENPRYFSDLARGQNPNMLYIGCSDSRVGAEEIMGVSPGEVFVHRNIANIVHSTDISAQAVIEFAVVHLKVRHVVVCGHYLCGGVHAAMNTTPLGIIDPWIDFIRSVYRANMQELTTMKNFSERFDRLVELNTEAQCEQVMKICSVRTSYEQGTLTIHGWVFDIRNGMLKDLGVDNSILHTKTSVPQ